MREDDLVVLLSERAASEIHKKWCDTLKVFPFTSIPHVQYGHAHSVQ